MYAAPDDWLMMRPQRFSHIVGVTARDMNHAPCRFTSNTRLR